MKRCGLYIRVSTEKQAKVQEGSLKNQDQLLTAHAEIKSKVSQEEWLIVDRYVDEGKSAKDIKGRPQYLRMLEDIEKGRIDTILCTALSRISRSTRDLLDMVEYFKAKGVDFICLKEDFDTTTAQGKCFLTIMGALNEFEREQTSERTRSNMLARAERGLWNGGQVLGYGLKPDKKGFIIPDEKEKEIVNFCFDTYLEYGSVLKTSEIVNLKGYHTKEYSTRRDKFHSGKKFGYSPMLKLLTNLTYVAKREINKKWMHKPQESLPEDRRYRIVDAVWEPIVDKDKFYKVQDLLKENLLHHYNGAKATKHFYLLNGGLLHCHKCGSLMEGRSAWGKKNSKPYYYYVCKNSLCRFKLPEPEIESVIKEAMKTVGARDDILDKIVDRTNARLKEELPKMSEQKQKLQRELESLTSQANHMMEKYLGIKDGEDFVKENLAGLSDRKRRLQNDIAASEILINDIERDCVDKDFISSVFCAFDEIYRDDIKPYQRRELLYRTVRKIELSDKVLRVGIPIKPSNPISNIGQEYRKCVDPTSHFGSQINLSKFRMRDKSSLD